MVDLSDEATKSTRRDIDLLAIIGTARRVDVKAGQNFADGLVDSQNNLLHALGMVQGCAQHFMYLPERAELGTGSQL